MGYSWSSHHSLPILAHLSRQMKCNPDACSFLSPQPDLATKLLRTHSIFANRASTLANFLIDGSRIAQHFTRAGPFPSVPICYNSPRSPVDLCPYRNAFCVRGDGIHKRITTTICRRISGQSSLTRLPHSATRLSQHRPGASIVHTLTTLPFSRLFAIHHPSRDGTPFAHILFRRPIHILVSISQEVAMPILKRLQSYLDSHKIPYEVVSHPTAYTAHDVAATLHVSGNVFAKVVMVKADERFVMAVLPSTWRVDLKRLRDVLEAREVRLATERECAELFLDCDVGTMPPFGNLYGVEVYVDQLLTEDESIVFEAGTYVGAMKLLYKDFSALVRPKVAAFHHEPSKLAPY